LSVFLGLFISLTLIMLRPKGKINQPISSIIRKPAVAGSFYPANKQQLTSQLNNFFQQVKVVPSAGKLKILIVPHAGIVFSGQTAAWGFKQIENKNYQKIILLGASHTAWFNHAAVFNQGVWETPLGRVAVDEKTAEKIIDKSKNIVIDLNPHWQEHDLEVEVIFLQKVLRNFKIVPILISNPNDQLVDSLADNIQKVLDDKTLLVVSSDLSHYPSWSVANEVDNQTIQSILSGKEKSFEQTIQSLETKNYPGLETAACGYQAIRIALKIGEQLNLKWEKLKYENSGDVELYGDKDRVVGYGAVAGFENNSTKDETYLDNNAKKEALTIARQTLKQFLESNKIPTIIPESQFLKQPLGAFVTLRNGDQLRGCIGEFEPKEPLYKVIQTMAIAAATDDPRFHPVTASELPKINIEISVMTPKKEIDDWKKIRLGKHGVVIQQGWHGGTFLPQVAQETGWTLEEFLSALCTEKAGLPSDCYRDPQTKIYVFEAQVFEEDK